MNDNNRYINYHCHSYYSNSIIADSPVSPKEYIDRIKELGHTTYVSTEHGISFNWVVKYSLCKKNNIKFVYGVEGYIEYNGKVYHILFMARNKNGMFQINRMISDAVINNFKYKRPRVTIDLIKKYINTNDVVCTTACIGGVLKESSLSLFKELFNIFGKDLLLEVAYHPHPIQITINKLAKELSLKYGCRIIAGNDSHYIYESQKILRDELLESRRIIYSDEEDDESSFYMDYPDRETMFNRFKSQGIWSDDEINSMIDITNEIENYEDIEFDNEWKVPTLYKHLTPIQRKQLLVDEAFKRWKKYSETIPESLHDKYKKEILMELKEWIKCNMEDYLLTASRLVERGKELGGVVTMSGRGSCSSYVTTTIFGLSTIDRIQSKVPLLPERFMTADRIISAHSTPDYDINVYNREFFIQAQDELLGENMNYQLTTYGTLKEKSAFRMLCKVRDDISMEQQLYITNKINEFERDYKYADEEERELMSVDDYIKDQDMLKIYKEAEKFLGTIIDIKGSPCSWAISNDNLMEIFCLCKAPNGDVLLNIEGKNIEDFGYLKMDWLLVDAVGIIDAVYKEIDIPIPTSNELSWLVRDDKPTWDIYSKGITCCVNQIEKPKTKEKCMAYKPKSIEELCAFIAGIRPAFASNYSKFEAREHFSYGVKEIDELLRGEYLDDSWLLYQEQIMQILKYCGFEAKETYTILKAISKKKEDVIMGVKDKFYNKMIEIIGSDKIDTINEIWQVIIDSSSYAFNSSHSYCMAHDSLWIAYAKAHYPQQTYVALIKYFTEKRKLDKVRLLKQEAQQYFNITIEDRKFGQDNRSIHINNNKIYQSLGSIKGINQSVGDIVYKMKDNKYASSLDLYKDLSANGLNKTQIENLAKINYFPNSNEIIWLANNYKEVLQLNKSNIPKIITANEIKNPEIFTMKLFKRATKETDKQLKYQDNTIYIKTLLEHVELPYINNLQKYYWEMNLIGEVISHNQNYDFYSVEKYIESKGSLLLFNPQNGINSWFGYQRGLKFGVGDIVAVGKNYEVSDKGWVRINQLINLTKLYK